MVLLHRMQIFYEMGSGGRKSGSIPDILKKLSEKENNLSHQILVDINFLNDRYIIKFIYTKMCQFKHCVSKSKINNVMFLFILNNYFFIY
jgi:hypothetical protein